MQTVSNFTFELKNYAYNYTKEKGFTYGSN